MTVFTINMDNPGIVFSVHHLQMTKIKGTFSAYTAKLEAPTILDIHTGIIEIKVDVANICSMDLARNQHLMSADFWDADRFPKIFFKKQILRQIKIAYTS